MQGCAAEWERQRKIEPLLQLTPLRDNLEWLFAGSPDPEVSLVCFFLCVEETDTTEAGRHLLEFFKGYRSTFMNSGWVRAAVGRIALANKQAAQEFMEAYWRRRSASRQNRTRQALDWVKGVHRKHWLNAHSWMQGFRKRQHSPQEKDERFINRAVESYGARAGLRSCTCLAVEHLKTIAATVLDQ